MHPDTRRTKRFIHRYRKRLGFTQAQFGAVFDLPRTVISRYETGRSQAPGGLIIRILDFERKLKARQSEAD